MLQTMKLVAPVVLLSKVLRKMACVEQTLLPRVAAPLQARRLLRMLHRLGRNAASAARVRRSGRRSGPNWLANGWRADGIGFARAQVRLVCFVLCFDFWVAVSSYCTVMQG